MRFFKKYNTLYVMIMEGANGIVAMRKTVIHEGIPDPLIISRPLSRSWSQNGEDMLDCSFLQ